MLPLISVIVPVYNMERYLDKCVDSILNQTYKNIEIILVDDGSVDNSPQICDRYANDFDNVKVIHKENKGQSSARNVGLDVCQGEYIGFVDSDDWISPTMYEKMFSLIQNNEMIVNIGMQEISDNGIVVRSRIHDEKNDSKQKLLSDILLHKSGASVCTKLFPTKIVNKVRFNEQRLNEDLLFMVDVVDKIDCISYSSDVGYFYLNRNGSTSRVFGKAVHDMVGNARDIRRHIDEFYPSLSKEAERFEICQHISFLLCCPSDYDRKSDPMCKEVLTYVRKNMVKGILNPYLTLKDKMKLFGVVLCPRLMSKMVEKKSIHK